MTVATAADFLVNPHLFLPNFSSAMRQDDMESDGALNMFTFNVDFALNYAQVNASVDKFIAHADIVAFQEAKNVSIAKVVQSDKKISAFQVAGTDAQRGSALAIRESDTRHFTPHGLFMLTPKALDLNARYGLPGVLRVRGREPLTVLTLHAPPKRDWELDRTMIASLSAWYRAQTGLVAIGADWNLHNGDAIWRNVMAALPGMKIAVDGGIDKILVSKDIRVKRKWIGPRTASDHRPAACTLILPEKKN